MKNYTIKSNKLAFILLLLFFCTGTCTFAIASSDDIERYKAQYGDELRVRYDIMKSYTQTTGKPWAKASDEEKVEFLSEWDKREKKIEREEKKYQVQTKKYEQKKKRSKEKAKKELEKKKKKREKELRRKKRDEEKRRNKLKKQMRKLQRELKKRQNK